MNRLSKALSTNQREMNFTEWLMEIIGFSRMVRLRWGDRGLVRYQPPCQALAVPSFIQSIDLNASQVRALFSAQGKEW